MYFAGSSDHQMTKNINKTAPRHTHLLYASMTARTDLLSQSGSPGRRINSQTGAEQTIEMLSSYDCEHEEHQNIRYLQPNINITAILQCIPPPKKKKILKHVEILVLTLKYV